MNRLHVESCEPYLRGRPAEWEQPFRIYSVQIWPTRDLREYLFETFGVPNRIRTGVAAVKGRCPGPLDDGDAGSRRGRAATV